MPKKSKLRLPPLDLGKETLGRRIARLRKEGGMAQVELAKKMGLTPGLVSDYERDRLRLHSEMVVRFALALEVSTDELLGLSQSKNNRYKPSLKTVRRMMKIETLPSAQQKIALKNIDVFLKGLER